MISNLVFLGHDNERYVGFSGSGITVQTPPDNDPLYDVASFAILGWYDTNVMLLRATIQQGVGVDLRISDGESNILSALIADSNEGLRDSYWKFDSQQEATWSISINVSRAAGGQNARWIFTKGKAM